jgi:uncharacterized protein
MSPGFDQVPPPAGALTVGGFASGGFRIGGTVYEGAILLTPERVTAWSPADPAHLDVADFEAVLTAEPPVPLVLVGTGASGGLPDMRLVALLGERGLAVEFMSSRAAARTYNVLVAEGRRLAAVLLPV